MMEEFNIQGKQTSFYKYSPGTFGYTLVYMHVACAVMLGTCLVITRACVLNLKKNFL